MDIILKLLEVEISGLKILETGVFKDSRGKFTKIFNNDFFKENDLDIQIKESYYSTSHKGVIRGMHFQAPPQDHLKLVHVTSGKIVDVVLDIRKNSSTYGKTFDVELSAKNAKTLIIPKGLAHGFKSLEDNTNVIYMQTSGYAPECDMVIRFDSFGYDWGLTETKISERDLSFERFETFDSPFICEESL